MKNVPIIVIVLLIFASGCIPKEQSQLSINYFYNSEISYQKIVVNQRNITYIYFDDAEGNCSDWLYAYPCWTEEKLSAKEITLSAKEEDEIISLIKDSGFMELDDVYNLDGRYPYIISIKLGEDEKSVEYRSSLDAEPEPEAFAEIKDKLLELVKN